MVLLNSGPNDYRRLFVLVANKLSTILLILETDFGVNFVSLSQKDVAVNVVFE